MTFREAGRLLELDLADGGADSADQDRPPLKAGRERPFCDAGSDTGLLYVTALDEPFLGREFGFFVQ